MKGGAALPLFSWFHGDVSLHGRHNSPRWRLKEMLEARHHPLDILAIVATIALVLIIIRGFLFRFALTPLLGATLLELHSSNVLLLLLTVQLPFTFLSGKTSRLTLRFVLLHWRPRRLEVNIPLHGNI